MRVAAKGLPVVVVNPSFVFGPDDPTGTSNGLIRRLLLRRLPAYTDGGAQHRGRPRRGRAATCSPTSGGTRASATCSSGRNFTLQRLFADLGRIAGVPPPPRARCTASLMLAGDRGAGAGRPARAGLLRRGPLGDAVVDLPQRQGAPGARLHAAPARGDARGHGRAGSSSSSATAPPATTSTDAALRVSRRRALRPSRNRLVGMGSALMEGRARRVLYRCRTPTNFLCPCGAAARRLKKLGLEYRDRARALPALRPSRDRRADQAGARACARRRRRGDPRLEADPRVPRWTPTARLMTRRLSLALQLKAMAENGNSTEPIKLTDNGGGEGQGAAGRPGGRPRAGPPRRGSRRRLLRLPVRARLRRPQGGRSPLRGPGRRRRGRQGQHAVRLRLRGRLGGRPPGRRLLGQQPERRRGLRLRLLVPGGRGRGRARPPRASSASSSRSGSAATAAGPAAAPASPTGLRSSGCATPSSSASSPESAISSTMSQPPTSSPLT